VLSHWLGLIGEGLNFFGALVMALDVFLRHKEHVFQKKLDALARVARTKQLHSTTYEGYRLSSEDFSYDVLHRRSTITAYIGVALLAFGFLFLATYHGLEIWDAHLNPSRGVQGNSGWVCNVFPNFCTQLNEERV
jgi:hypothetical protein